MSLQPANRTLRLDMKSQMPLYAFVAVLFVMGVIFGSLMVNALPLGQKQDLFLYLDSFFRLSTQQQEVSARSVIWDHFGGDVKWIALVFLFGLSVIGLPLVLLLDFLKGVLIGFTVGFMASEMSWKGMLLALASVAPHNLLLIPALLIASAASISFSIHIVKNRLLAHRGAIGEPLLQMSTVTVGMVLLVFGAALLQTYLSPALIRWATEIAPTSAGL